MTRHGWKTSVDIPYMSCHTAASTNYNAMPRTTRTPTPPPTGGQTRTLYCANRLWYAIEAAAAEKKMTPGALVRALAEKDKTIKKYITP